MAVERLAGGSIRRSDDPGEPSTGAPRVSIAEEEAAILTVFAAGRRALEIGTGLGVSTRALAERAALVTTFDIDPWVQSTIWPELPENVRPVKSLTNMAGHWFDVVFIDADHSTEAVAADLETAGRMVRPGGVIVCHDSNYGNVSAALTGADWTMLRTTHGLAWRWV